MRLVFAGPATLDLIYRVDRIPGPDAKAQASSLEWPRAEPVRWWSGGRTGTVAVPPVAAADTAGAGDVFHGALTVAVDAGRPFVDAPEYAVAVAGIRVSHAGPRAWLDDSRLADLRTGRR